MKNTISKAKYDRIMRAVRQYGTMCGKCVGKIENTTVEDAMKALDKVMDELIPCIAK